MLGSHAGRPRWHPRSGPEGVRQHLHSTLSPSSSTQDRLRWLLQRMVRGEDEGVVQLPHRGDAACVRARKTMKTPSTGSKYKQGEGHYAWKGDDARPETKRERAQRRYSLSACERCGGSAIDRHHRDEDTGNNAPSNVWRLCRRCHMVVDGRLERFVAMAKASAAKRRKPPKPCAICERVTPRKRLMRGRCGRCNEFFRRHGFERPFVLSRKPAENICSVCGRDWPNGLKRKRCARCYNYLRTYGIDRPIDLGHGNRGRRRGEGLTNPIGLSRR